MKASLATKEPQWIKQWNKDGLYDALQKHHENSEPFILHDGPPYANGAIHIGHAVNKILKDIIVKSKMLSGYRAPYVPGWDCHGLPIEVQVEKKVGKVGKKVDAKTFRQKCRDYAENQVNIQKQDFIRLGVLGDWERPYLTKSFDYEANMIRALAEIAANDHIEKGVKPVNWCFDCGSALAEAEIEYQDKTSPAIDVAFNFVDGEAVSQKFAVQKASKSIALPIWTTTPWTIPANQAVSLHPELKYALVTGHPTHDLVIAAEMVDAVMARLEVDDHEVLAEVSGQDLELLQLKHPLYDKQVPVIMGEHVNTEAGTGAVHTAPGHGVDDFNVGKTYDLEVYNPVDSDGVYLPDTELFAGQHVWQANKTVTEALSEAGQLLHHENIRHSYPHCWRHKTPTAFRTTPQWFISMDKQGLRQGALAEIKQVEWIPEWGEERIYKMIENRPEWCISRQRTWGVPITLYVHKQSGELHPDTPQIMAQVADLVEQKGLDIWYDLDDADLIGGDVEDYEKVTDVLDVWFDSGVTHYCVLKQNPALQEPADLYLEGSDQHRGWFHSSLLTGVAINQRAPYKQVLTHGFVVDKDGKKMSKSMGNVISPKDVVNTLGADILRLWVSSADYRGEMTISDEILNRAADGYRRIRNTARFMLGNLNEFTANDLLPLDQCAEIDLWAIDKAQQLQQEVIQYYDAYQLHLVYQKVHHFCSQDMGAFYLDVIKDRLYTCHEESAARKSAQTAMFHILSALQRLIAPILTFTADEIRQSRKQDEHILFARWYEFPEVPFNDQANKWQRIAGIRQAVSKQLEILRVAGQIGSSLDAEVKLFLPDDLYQQLSAMNAEMRFILITSEAIILPWDERGDAEVIELPEVGSIALAVSVADGEKCERCWHIRTDVGINENHPTICGRCVENVDGHGEVRHFA
ncbi:isoleucine--tRNA ligase [Marinicella sp. S1101]|uniref:isoleucine--tRNA ligase n=1 Tax=Marinicella marina TaxID=2996016 RepID=UPI002260C2A3|nr:isoleucine--tRNA ligase [Marinicella marina]MCX7554639.1 isoleucine--tRNA ligase [Marinicella marina]MDJ1140704.1 isoleucine--tRNA ligase [Marinicella marina]